MGFYNSNNFTTTTFALTSSTHVKTTVKDELEYDFICINSIIRIDNNNRRS